MRNSIIAILFFSSLAVCKESSILYKINNEAEISGEKKPEVKDDWIAIDKLQHFSYSLLISLGCQYVLVNKMNNTELMNKIKFVDFDQEDKTNKGSFNIFLKKK